MRIERIGDATLYLGDCAEVIPTVLFNSVVTDPPYGVSHKRGDSKLAEGISGDVVPPDVRWMAAYPAIIWGGNNFCDQLPRSSGWLVWDKTFPECARHSQAEIAWSNVRKTVRHYTEAYHGFMRGRDGWFHPTQKPPGLMRWCVSMTTGIVVDPYMGSGTTGVACARLARPFIGVEVDPKHFDSACVRIERAQQQVHLPFEPAHTTRDAIAAAMDELDIGPEAA